MYKWFDSYYGSWNILNNKGDIIKTFDNETELNEYVKINNIKIK